MSNCSECVCTAASLTGSDVSADEDASCCNRQEGEMSVPRVSLVESTDNDLADDDPQ